MRELRLSLVFVYFSLTRKCFQCAQISTTSKQVNIEKLLECGTTLMSLARRAVVYTAVALCINEFAEDKRHDTRATFN
jgi:hypothetical protein